MAIWNNGYPASYQPMYQPQMYQQYQQQQTAQMTPPTIRAEIVQVDGEEAAKTFPVGAGATQMLMAKDDSAIYIKTALPNGQTTLDVFQKRPPAPPAPVFDPGEYVRKDEFDERLNAILDALDTNQKEQPIQTPQKAPQRKVKQEVE